MIDDINKYIKRINKLLYLLNSYHENYKYPNIQIYFNSIESNYKLDNLFDINYIVNRHNLYLIILMINSKKYNICNIYNKLVLCNTIKKSIYMFLIDPFVVVCKYNYIHIAKMMINNINLYNKFEYGNTDYNYFMCICIYSIYILKLLIKKYKNYKYINTKKYI